MTPDQHNTIRSLGCTAGLVAVFGISAIFAAVKNEWSSGQLILLAFVVIFCVASFGAIVNNLKSGGGGDDRDDRRRERPDPKPPGRAKRLSESEVPDFLPDSFRAHER